MTTRDYDDWLKQMTGRPGSWWIATIQARIAKRSRKSRDPKHDVTDVSAWLADLVGLVVKTMPHPVDVGYDGNMRAAAVLGVALTLWYSRVQLAKVSDPKRPIALRQGAYKRWLNYFHALANAAVDNRQDAAYFPGQSWQSPFLAEADDGEFV